jgi:hypothetical protein
MEMPPRSKPATAKIPDLASLVPDTLGVLGVKPEGLVAVVNNIRAHEPRDRREN